MVKEIKGTKRNNDVINDLTMFSANGGFINPGRPPKRNEPFYRDYIADKLIKAGAKKGVFLRITDKKTGTTIEGALSNDIYQYTTLLELLICGRKKWKNHNNIVYISITDIEKFSILDKEPLFFKNVDAWVEPTANNVISEDDRAIILAKYKDANISEDIFVNITADVFCKPVTKKYKSKTLLANTVVSAELIVVDKQDNVKTFDDLQLRHIYPNKDYVSLCDKYNETGNIILRYEKYDELLNIAYIACTWTLSVNDEEVKIMNIVYPEFEKNDDEHIYNINLRAVSLNDEALSLHHTTVFSGETYTD